jgi:hypothetical protein
MMQLGRNDKIVWMNYNRPFVDLHPWKIYSKGRVVLAKLSSFDESLKRAHISRFAMDDASVRIPTCVHINYRSF